MGIRLPSGKVEVSLDPTSYESIRLFVCMLGGEGVGKIRWPTGFFASSWDPNFEFRALYFISHNSRPILLYILLTNFTNTQNDN